jgi:hypothetical protein
MKEKEKAKRGRPSLENPRGKSLAINISEDEKTCIQIVAKGLGYTSISAFLRSAITKGILSSQAGVLTSNADLIHWNYLAKHWKFIKHLEENEEYKK